MPNYQKLKTMVKAPEVRELRRAVVTSRRGLSGVENEKEFAISGKPKDSVREETNAVSDTTAMSVQERTPKTAPPSASTAFYAKPRRTRCDLHHNDHHTQTTHTTTTTHKPQTPRRLQKPSAGSSLPAQKMELVCKCFPAQEDGKLEAVTKVTIAWESNKEYQDHFTVTRRTRRARQKEVEYHRSMQAGVRKKCVSRSSHAARERAHWGSVC